MNMKYIMKPKPVLFELACALILLFSTVLIDQVAGDDLSAFVDPTYQCPFLTTCRQVCVAVVGDCPASLRCQTSSTPDATTTAYLTNSSQPPASMNLTLCADGSCAETCDPSLESPCPYECAPVACQTVVETIDQCRAQYDHYYQQEDACGAVELEEELRILSFTEPAFIAGYCWLAGMAMLIVMWCAYK